MIIRPISWAARPKGAGHDDMMIGMIIFFDHHGGNHAT